MARKMKKFSAGGAQGRYDRRIADIKKDFAKDSAGKSGRALEVLEAKQAQRTADAKDDLAKRTGADRTATRAAEKAAESNLTKTRKYGAPQSVTKDTAGPTGKVSDTLGALTAPKMDSSIGKPQSFGAAFKDARSRLGAGKTFTFNGKSYTTDIAGEGRKPVQKAAVRTNNSAGTSSSSTNRNAAPVAAADKPKNTPIAAPALIARNASSDAQAAKVTKPKDAPKAAPKRYETPAEAKARVAGLTGSAKRRENFADMFGMGSVDSAKSRAKLLAFREAEKARNAARAKGSKPLASGSDTGAFFTYGKAAAEKNAANKAKGGKVKKKETTMKYAKGGSTPANKKPAPKEPITGGANTVPLTPERKEFLKELAKRNAKPGMAKGGKATKFGAAMKKKSADTKGRAMVKKCSGGSMKKYAKGGSIDGIAKKGKTKGKVV